MKKILLIIFNVLINHVHAQSPNFSFAKNLDAWAVNSKIDANGDIVSVGYFNGTKDFDPGIGTYTLSNAQGSLFIQKLNSTGDLIWAKNFGATGFSTTDNVIKSLQISQNNDYIICGTYNENGDFNPGTSVNMLNCNTDNTNFFIARYDSSGNLLWANGIGANGSGNNETAENLTIDNNGDLIVVGTFMNYFPNFTDFDPSAATYTIMASGGSYVAKYTANGDFINVKNFQTLNHQFVFSYPNNDLLILGYSQGANDYDPSPTTTYTINTSYPGSYQGQTYYLRINSNLDFVSAKAISGVSVNKFTSASVDPLLMSLICTIDCAGATTDSDPSASITNTLNTHFSNYGKIIQRLDGDMNLLFAKNVKKDYNASFTNGTDNYANIKDTLVKYDNSGNVIWKYRTIDAMPVSIIYTPSNSLYVSGLNLGNANCDPITNNPDAILSGNNGYLLKWDLGINTSVFDKDKKTDLILFPNPVSDKIQIKPIDQENSIIIYNTLGEIVLTKNIEKEINAIDVSSLKSGVYYITINNQTKKFIKE